jgi:hypothetical protein
MKLVREHLNEIFVADSDPIYDLGIGGYSYETLRPGAILKNIKHIYTTDYAISKNSYLLIIRIENINEYKKITFLNYNSNATHFAFINKSKFHTYSQQYLDNITNIHELNIYKSTFYSKFEIIERGI